MATAEASSPVARRAHNPKVERSDLAPLESGAWLEHR